MREFILKYSVQDFALLQVAEERKMDDAKSRCVPVWLNAQVILPGAREVLRSGQRIRIQNFVYTLKETMLLPFSGDLGLESYFYRDLPTSQVTYTEIRVRKLDYIFARQVPAES